MISDKTLEERGFKTLSEYNKYKYANDQEYRERILERRRKYVATHKELIKAKTDTDENRAYRRKKWKEYYERDKTKYLVRSKANYFKSKPEILANRKEAAIKSKLACVEYLGGKCEICGYADHTAALQFHHIDPREKEFMLTKKIANGVCVDALKEELDKCSLLCANCHSIISYMQQQNNREALLANMIKEKQ